MVSKFRFRTFWPRSASEDSDTHRIQRIQTPTDLGIQRPTDLGRGDWPAQGFAAFGRCSETRPIVTAEVCVRSIGVRRQAGCPVGLRTEVIGAHEAATLPNESVMETRVD
jgi:hypothetical protein